MYMCTCTYSHIGVRKRLCGTLHPHSNVKLMY